MKIRIPIFNNFLQDEIELSWRDVVATFTLIALFWILVRVLDDINISIDQAHIQTLDMSYGKIPYYMLRSTLRMFIAYGASLLFTMIFGYWAYRSKRARAIIIPAVDILQSVPVLGFLSITVTGFMAIFPHRLIGIELASLFAIFTGQVWNMTLSFYHSLITLPNDLQEVAGINHLNPWKRFSRLELPASTISLVWNSMMSFGGGWFFVVQSEMITVLNKHIKLPGIGSYMGAALEKGDSRAALYAVLAMIFTIIFIDQCLWKPVTIWSQKFKNEQVQSGEHANSLIFDILSKSKIVDMLSDSVFKSIDWFFNLFFKNKLVQNFFSEDKVKVKNSKTKDNIFNIVVIAAVAILLFYSFSELKDKFTLTEILTVLKLGSYTMGRVFLMVVLSTLIWTPIGVWVGFKPKIAKIVRPFAQIGASFPINMTFPIIVAFYINHDISMNWGSIFLLSLGAQWYILFNVIAGASSIPSDMKESAKIFKLRGIKLWRRMIIPAIFPFWVTGACTAAGGAWNASIVAEYAIFGKEKLVAQGLGAYITQVTNDGNWNGIFLSITVMSLFVVLINRFLWRNLYKFSAEKFHIE